VGEKDNRLRGRKGKRSAKHRRHSFDPNTMNYWGYHSQELIWVEGTGGGEAIQGEKKKGTAYFHPLFQHTPLPSLRWGKQECMAMRITRKESLEKKKNSKGEFKLFRSYTLSKDPWTGKGVGRGRYSFLATRGQTAELLLEDKKGSANKEPGGDEKKTLPG